MDRSNDMIASPFVPFLSLPLWRSFLRPDANKPRRHAGRERVARLTQSNYLSELGVRFFRIRMQISMLLSTVGEGGGT